MLLATACTLRAQSPAPATQDTQKLKIETALLIENFRKGEREMQKLERQRAAPSGRYPDSL
jgi:hypothetical protein